MTSVTSARLRIVVVEDDEDLAFTLVYNLKKDGRYEIERFAGGLVALDELLVRPPDLIVLDLNLPDVDGLTICRELKKHEETRRVPIIMLTARVEERDKLLGFELGADDYVTKPFSMKELLARIAAPSSAAPRCRSRRTTSTTTAISASTARGTPWRAKGAPSTSRRRSSTSSGSSSGAGDASCRARPSCRASGTMPPTSRRAPWTSTSVRSARRSATA